MSLVKSFIQQRAREKNVPSDWCYLYNFKDLYEPVALNLFSGNGKILKKEMEHLVQLPENELPETFSSEEYSTGRKEKLGEIRNAVNEFARERDFTIEMTMMGPMIIPFKNGKPINQEEL